VLPRDSSIKRRELVLPRVGALKKGIFVSLPFFTIEVEF
jgi:hypothetical protein